jgi:cyclopropane-fatty-acyl-phospholipid synthase
MSLISSTIRVAERGPLPDPLMRMGIGFLVGRTRRKLAAATDEQEENFARAMAEHPIAEHAGDANRQHYELPPGFFALTLGPRRKYSCCLYPTGHETLAEAERLALDETVAHAGLADGQSILELGCGWGSLTLFMAERFPRASITAVSNSAQQRLHIEGEAAARGLGNIRVVTADMNAFAPDGTYDRVVSVEMFEHMSNWTPLLQRVRRCLADEGRLFIHIFTHKTTPYRFHVDDKDDWIAQHFFTGGIMPSHGLIHRFPTLFTVENEWRWSGTHYRKTAAHWLENYDRNSEAALDILRGVYGDYAALWQRRWRLFFLATMGLFGHNGGTEWGVSHYRLKPS